MACKKASYRTEAKASAALQRILANPRDMSPPTSYYECPYCYEWHLTKKMQKFTGKNPRRNQR